MSTAAALDQLRSQILSGYSLLFLKTWEEERWLEAISTLAMEIERGLVVWSVTEGLQPPADDAAVADSAPEFLAQVAAYPSDHIVFVKDFHPFLEDPVVVRRLRDLAAQLSARNKTLLFVSPSEEIPVELRKDTVLVELPLPETEELREELSAVIRASANGPRLELSSEEEDRICKAVLGLTLREARKAMARALLGRDRVDDEVYTLLVAEKRRMVQGSDLLEFYDLDEGVADVGGLDALKEWLGQRADAFGPRAQEQGIPSPKGVLLLGVQGCGKSLTARATAKLLHFPLVRLDVSRLLASDRGTSERNMRDVLRLMEMIAPAVLWLDELEKGFAGLDGEKGSDGATIKRIVGGFLTWMEERRAPVFVVATANSVQSLPPEMVRRGRFDELFFVDLPNFHERQDIFRIHISKRGWKPEKYDIEELSSKTEGFSGSEIAEIVNSAIIDSFARGHVLRQEDLLAAREATVPLSVTLEEQIFELREWARSRCRPATPDSRVLQMLEMEQRRGGLNIDAPDDDVDAQWKELAEHGQLNAAVVEMVTRRRRVTLPELQQALAPYAVTEGDMGLALRADPNVVLWVGMSADLTEILSKLIASKRIYLHPAPADAYTSQGHSVRKLPVVEQVAGDRREKPGWLPVLLRAVPPEDPEGRFARVARVKLSR